MLSLLSHSFDMRALSRVELGCSKDLREDQSAYVVNTEKVIVVRQPSTNWMDGL